MTGQYNEIEDRKKTKIKWNLMKNNQAAMSNQTGYDFSLYTESKCQAGQPQVRVDVAETQQC